MTNELVTKDHFTDLRTQIAQIKKDNANVVFDYVKDDKEARSHVATLRKSKTAINNLHKEKKKFFLEEGRKIDAGKNELIADVEEMIAVHAEPLQAIKDKKDAEVEEERQKVIRELEEEERLKAQALADREAEIARKEAELQKMEDDRIAKEQAEQAEKDRIANELKIKKDAEEKATKDAEEKTRKAQEESDRLIREAKEREEQLVVDAQNKETKRLSDIVAADKKAEKDKQDAIDKVIADQKASDKLLADKLAAEKVIADRKAKNLNHVKAVNNRVLAKLTEAGMSTEHAKEVMEDIIKNKIPEITINY